MPQPSYPIHLDIANRLCLVVGGGPVAERRVRGLLDAAARVTVVSPALSPELERLRHEGHIAVVSGEYEPGVLTNVFLVVAATNVREVNARVIQDAKARGVLVNAADAPEEGDFLVPSVLRRGELCLSLATGGNNPMLSSRLAAELESRFGPEYADYVELLGQMRLYIKKKTSDLKLRRAAHVCLLDGEARLLHELRNGNSDAARQLAETLVEPVLKSGEASPVQD